MACNQVGAPFRVGLSEKKTTGDGGVETTSSGRARAVESHRTESVSVTSLGRRDVVQKVFKDCQGAQFVNASDMKQFGYNSYDPGLMHTATCTSAITFIDGEKGRLTFRGYPIEVLAERSNFLEVSRLLIDGKLPEEYQLRKFEEELNTYLLLQNKKIWEFVKVYSKDTDPMTILPSAISSLSDFYAEIIGANVKESSLENFDNISTLLMAKMPVLVAMIYRHWINDDFVEPRADFGFVHNFLHMMFTGTIAEGLVTEENAKILDSLFLVHADHGQNLSTSVLRAVVSGGAGALNALSAGVSALSGSLHGGAAERAFAVFNGIYGSDKSVSAWLEDAKADKRKIMGVGHRVYKCADPRAVKLRELVNKLSSENKNPLFEIAKELEEAILADEYFVQRNLYPNMDFYSGLLFDKLGFSEEMFPLLFALARTSGWLAHWREAAESSETKLNRPKQVYEGEGERGYVALQERR